jgi:hypothetical protein
LATDPEWLCNYKFTHTGTTTHNNPPSASTPIPAPSSTVTIQPATRTATLQPTQTPTPTKAEEIGPNAVWQSYKNAIPELQDCLLSGSESTDKCVVSIMTKYDASQEAIAFYEKYKHGGSLVYFKELGRVDLGTVFYPAAADGQAPALPWLRTAVVVSRRDFRFSRASG